MLFVLIIKPLRWKKKKRVVGWMLSSLPTFSFLFLFFFCTAAHTQGRTGGRTREELSIRRFRLLVESAGEGGKRRCVRSVCGRFIDSPNSNTGKAWISESSSYFRRNPAKNTYQYHNLRPLTSIRWNYNACVSWPICPFLFESIIIPYI